MKNGFRLLALSGLLISALWSGSVMAESLADETLGDCARLAPPPVGPGHDARRALVVGACLVDAGRPDRAEAWFAEHASEFSSPAWRAALDNELGRIRTATGRLEEARELFEQARSAGEARVSAAASISLAQLEPAFSRLPLLSAALDASRGVPPDERAPLLLAIGKLASALNPEGRALSASAFFEAQRLAEADGSASVRAQALDGLAQVREDEGDLAGARAMNDRAVLEAGQVGRDDLMLAPAWRRGRLLRHAGDLNGAISAFQQAADHLERIRRDIPVVYADGRSSFRETFEPIYLGLADLLLQHSAGPHQQVQLDRARRAVELVKQSELEDYLGDRCLLDVSEDESAPRMAKGVAVLYPIMLDDRLELLVESDSGLDRVTVAVSRSVIDLAARSYATALRRGAVPLGQARQLYQWLLKPIEDLLGSGLDTLVVVPDASLRLFPFSSLHDGEKYAIQKYALAVVPGLNLTRSRGTSDEMTRSRGLLAGLAEPGEVVAKLPPQLLRALGAVDVDEAARGVRSFTRSAAAAPPENARISAERTAHLAAALALPGVRNEIEALERLGAGKVLLDSEFTVSALESELAAGRFRLLHIASHGFFGGSAETTFLMAHDDLITIDRLQSLLRPAAGEAPVELLTLSACETAEGDDRAPLGLAGAALKARASAALGSLWPVADEATRELMQRFYAALMAGQSKVHALRAAQLDLLRQEAYQAPFFWAPFILVGDWN